MSKYKVGDVVKLRDDLEVGKEYGAEKLDEAMNDAIGKKAEIKDCYNDRYYAKFASRYGGCWLITDEMIEGLWEECKEKQDKLKLIDVLNMIAKGELKEGTKVKWDVFEYTYREDEFADECLERRNSDNKIVDILEDMYLRHLTAEVELIEPPCEDEHIVGADKTIEPSKTEELYKDDVLCLTDCQAIGKMIDKLNEVIRMVNAITNLLN